MKATTKKSYQIAIEKEFGKGVVQFADDDEDLQRLPFGLSRLDWLTLGGLPLGKISLLRGPEGGTKTSLAVICCARYLDRFKDDLAVYIDLEEKYPSLFGKRIALDTSRFDRPTLDTAEKTIDFVDFSLRRKEVGILVIDSIAAMLPKVEIEASAEDWQQGLAARLINKMIRKIVGAMIERKLKHGRSPTVILINQERFKIGVRFGDPTTIPGGEHQKYASSLILRLRTLARKKPTEDGISFDAPVVKVATTVVKHSFGKKGIGAEYLLWMEAFNGLLAGESNDEEFVQERARQLGLVKPNGKIDEEILKRGARYRSFKTEILQGLGKI